MEQSSAKWRTGEGGGGQAETVKCWKTLNRLGKRQPVNTSDPLDYYTCMRTSPAQKVTRVAQTKIHSARVSRITNLNPVVQFVSVEQGNSCMFSNTDSKNILIQKLSK